MTSRWDAGMGLALRQARLAETLGDVPIGAVVLGPAGARCHRPATSGRCTTDPTAHAEIVALRRAARALGSWRLDGCTLVVTLEPCTMCAGGAVAARVGRLVFGAFDPKAGAVVSLFDVVRDSRLNHRPRWCPASAPGSVRRCSTASSRVADEPVGGVRPIGAVRRQPGKVVPGDVSERPKELASKASVVQATEGSNPSVTAM